MRTWIVTVVLVACGSARSHDPPPQVIANAAPDAAVADAPADAYQIENDIVALSKFGFLTVDAKPPATVFVDGMKVGETPITRLPLAPGLHKLRVVAKGKKPVEKDVTIFGARDSDEGTITW